MKKISATLVRWYERFVLDHPVAVIVCLALILGGLGYKARDFRIDASAESLLLEHDQDLRYAREVSRRYGTSDFLLLSYAPKNGDLLDSGTMARLARLKNDLAALPQVESVLTILDVPLLESPPVSYAELSGSLPSLTAPGVDLKLARIELGSSPFFRNMLVSEDLRTTAVIIYLKNDPVYQELVDRRTQLFDRQAEGELNASEASELESVSRRIETRQEELNTLQHGNIQAVRAIMDAYRDEAEMFLGGISMIADDMISFIKNDLKIFGLGVFLLLVLMLGIIFKSLRWVILPMLCCFLAVIAMMGILGAFGWGVTVISSNFISLQLIITLAIVVHLIVRYREYQVRLPDADQRTLVSRTVRSKFVPCLYATLTTLAGFASLVLCDIKPVIQFGWMMGAGILVSLTLIFFLFPAFLMLFRRYRQPSESRLFGFSLTAYLADFTQKNGFTILAATVICSILTVIGISRLVVENSFIDYFKQSTEIYRGMKVIDQKLGGTTPLDVIVRFTPVDLQAEEEYAEDEPLLLPEEQSAPEDPNKYWFFDERLRVIRSVHDYLDGLPATGKVLSLGTVLAIGKKLNNGKPLDSIDMAVFYTKLPEKYKDLLLAPYVSFQDNETRFFLRIKDSMPGLKRDALLRQIQSDLTDTLGLAPDHVRLAGTMVLYNNMLQSLYASQIKTLGFVALALFAMFLLLFRSALLALIALFPNLLSAGAVLGVMGWLGIPLDMMTITIAAISIGIAVDDTIHYIYRFREEIQTDGDYIQTMHRCHGSIGHAMYYTSIIIIIGFSILALSNFWPTIYFGVLTGLAMVIALAAALTLLPALIVLLKPFGVQETAK